MNRKRTIMLIFAASLLISFTALPVAAKVLKLAHLNPQKPFDIATAAVSAVLKPSMSRITTTAR